MYACKNCGLTKFRICNDKGVLVIECDWCNLEKKVTHIEAGVLK